MGGIASKEKDNISISGYHIFQDGNIEFELQIKNCIYFLEYSCIDIPNGISILEDFIKNLELFLNHNLKTIELNPNLHPQILKGDKIRLDRIDYQNGEQLNDIINDIREEVETTTEDHKYCPQDNDISYDNQKDVYKNFGYLIQINNNNFIGLHNTLDTDQYFILSRLVNNFKVFLTHLKKLS